MDAKTADEVLANWERIKQQEKKDRGVLGGVPRSLPALNRAQRIGEKVNRVGFDWEDARGSREKVKEEMGELDRAIASGDPSAIEDEMGDVLFALVNLSRHAKVDAEGALRRTIDKFTRRFAHVEARVKADHGGWPAPGAPNLPLEVLDRYWEEAKATEVKEGEGGRKKEGGDQKAPGK
jgi:tetrapyrrole methylase family protein/MazG family protein/ATP diphosphatase